MKTNDLLFKDTVLRVLAINDEKVLVIDCIKKGMPFYTSRGALGCMVTTDMNKLLELTQTSSRTLDSLNPIQKKKMYERYSLISPILPFIDDEILRRDMIDKVSAKFQVSKQTIRKYLINFLVFQDIVYMAPLYIAQKQGLTPLEETFRCFLNKYFYTSKKMSLKTVYIIMLRDKFMDEKGNLSKDFPEFHCFRYFYYKTRTITNEICSREGVGDRKSVV